MRIVNKWLRLITGAAVLLMIMCGFYPAFASEGPSAVIPQMNDASYAEYAGYIFSGKDPWEGMLTITVRSIQDGKMEWTFTDSFEDHTLFQVQEDTVLQNGKAGFDIRGTDVEHEYRSFSYQGDLELRDGKMIVTFRSGSVTEESPEGGSSYRFAQALSDSGVSDQVILEKVDEGPYTTYIVQAGDSIHSIAQEYGIPTKDLAILNQIVIMETAKSHGLKFDDVTEYVKYLYPGEKLLVPVKNND